MRIGFAIYGTGWARVQLSAPGLYLDAEASWFADTPGQFCHGCAALLKPGGEATVSAITEPGAYKLILQRYGESVLLVLIVYDDQTFYLDVPSTGGRIAEVSRAPLEEVVTNTARTFLWERARLGEEGYGRMWGHPFPSEGLRQLCEATVLRGWSAA